MYYFINDHLLNLKLLENIITKIILLPLIGDISVRKTLPMTNIVDSADMIIKQ